MNHLGILLIMALVVGENPRDLVTQTAADRVTLRDGTVVRGLVSSVSNGHRGIVELIVRRDWARNHAKNQLFAWERTEAAAVKMINEQRRRRLSAWKRERSEVTGPNDSIMSWIDGERSALDDPNSIHQSTLLTVRISRTDVRAIDRPAVKLERLLRLGWISNLPDPESMSVDELKVALEGRGYDLETATQAQPPSLDRLLAPVVETEIQWLARRAATEIMIDDGVRFLRFNDVVLPDSGTAAPAAGDANLKIALSELKRLLDLDTAARVDPLQERLNAVAARGRVGALVTRLQIPPDMSGVLVETTMWLRTGPERWVVYGSRQSNVLTNDLDDQAGKAIEQDPQVQGVFGMVEMLGLGSIPVELKQRSLRIGAATQKALGQARSALNQDLEKLTLPVLDPTAHAAKPAREPDATNVPASPLK